MTMGLRPVTSSPSSAASWALALSFCAALPVASATLTAFFASASAAAFFASAASASPLSAAAMHGWHRCFAGPFLSWGFVNDDSGSARSHAEQTCVAAAAAGAPAAALPSRSAR